MAGPICSQSIEVRRASSSIRPESSSTVGSRPTPFMCVLEGVHVVGRPSWTLVAKNFEKSCDYR